MLLVHGMRGNLGIWDPVVGRLAAHMTVIAAYWGLFVFC